MSALFTRIENELLTLRAEDQLRVLSPPEGHDFCSNDYFKLSRHPEILCQVKKSLEENGYGSSSSRFIRGDRACFHDLAKKLARFKRSESAIIFPSGYMANVGVLASIIQKGDLVLSDRLNHASIIDGLRLSGAHVHIFDHLNVDEIIRTFSAAPRHVQKFLVTESLFSMDGDIAPLHKYQEIVERFDMGLVVDEAHALGLYGRCGSGLVDHFGIGAHVLLTINGLGKAFGCYGAFVAASSLVIEYLTQKARTLMYTTALPPLAASAIDAALTLVENGDDLRRKLFLNCNLLAEELQLVKRDLPSPIFPVVVGENQRAMMIADKMKSAGFDIRAIRPPTVPANSSRLRVTINTAQTEELIKDFAKTLRSFL